jgi:hypothetical protein
MLRVFALGNGKMAADASAAAIEEEDARMKEIYAQVEEDDIAEPIIPLVAW